MNSDGEGKPRANLAPTLLLLLALVPAAGCGERTAGIEEVLAVRLLEPRLSLTTTWSPCKTAGSSGERSPYCPGVDRAELFRTAALPALTAGAGATRGAAPSPAERHRLGLWSVAFGDGRSLDSTLLALRAAAEESGDGAAWNDLAVAYFTRGRLDGSALDLLAALDAVERAAAKTPAEPSVAFNQALFRQELHLLSAAERAWERYLEIDPSSPWSVEARERLVEVQTARASGRVDLRANLAAATDRQLRRHYLQEELLGAWAAEQARDPGRAAELLAEARARADVLAAETGDGLLAATVASLERAVAAGGPELDALVAGHEAYGRAVTLIAANRYREARPLFEEAGERLRAVGSPFTPWVDFHLQHAAYQEMRLDEVERLGQELLATTASESVSVVRARALWAMAVARFLAADPRGAVGAHTESLAILERVGEVPNAMMVRALLASPLDWLGQSDRAWELRDQVLRHLGSGENPQLRRLTALDAAFSARDLGETAAAAVFQEEVVLLAEEAGVDPLPLANALLKRAELAAEVAPSAALDDLRRAEDLAQSIEDEDRRTVTMTQVLASRGRVLRELEPARAVEDLERALDLSGRKLVLFRPEIAASLARAHERLGDPARAESELRSALDDLDRLRQSASRDAERIQLAARADEVQADLVRLLFEQGREDEALLAAQAARSQTLLDRLGVGNGAAAPEAAPPEPAAGEALITYQVHDDRLTTWVNDARGGFATTRPISARLLCSRVDDLHRQLQAGRDVRASLAELHQDLIAPVADRLAGIERLTLFPDDCLYHLPFAALLDASSGAFLVERFEIAVLPSFAFLREQRAREAGPRDAPRLLAIGDPAFDEALDPRLGRLAGAREEVAAIQLHYGDSTTLFGAAATPSAVAALVPAHDVLHVAAHAVDGGRQPLEGAILLSPEGEAPGLLRARQLVEHDYRHLRLVVLAACRTSGPVASGGEGPVGLAWPFLAGGAEAVVATLWPIDDRATARLLPAFHAAYARDGRPAAALREAQVEALRSGSPPHEWAGVTVFTAD